VRQLGVLGLWDWSYACTGAATLAAFVSPQNRVVASVTREAEARLRETTGEATFRSMLAKGGSGGEREVLRMIFLQLSESERWQVRYVEPRLQAGSLGGSLWQSVRPPHQIFDRTSPAAGGRATCLDLALFMAACLEHVGLFPLIVVTGDEPGVPSHAFSGCWAASAHGGRPLLTDREDIECAMDAGRLLAVECTGVARAGRAEGSAMDFEAAVEDARRRAREARWVCAVDVGALRPPHGTIAPMECPLDATVVFACESAEEFARAKGSPVLETAHLLYGLLAAEGEITKALLRDQALEPLGLRRQLESLAPDGGSSLEPVPTLNYSACLRDAEYYASQSGVSTVREEDLLWALLRRAQQSDSLRWLADELRLDLASMAARLGELRPLPTTIRGSDPRA
jgi:hypothetical protein